ncbi:MAG: MFS transporter [Acutalibacteraceae bacterium]|jgi:GPH family glycoside/pentoside/hexuronide:cation symporter
MNKIHGRGRLILYAFSGMGINMLNLMMGSYLCSALLRGGFGADAIPYQTYVGRDLVIAAVWAAFVLAAKIIDGVIDIPMASFTDNLRTRFGRRRPALVIGLIPLLASYLLFLVVPDPTGATLLNTVYYGIVLCVFYTSYTLTMVTYYATYTEIVDTQRERSTIANAKSVFDIVYYILGYVAVRALLNGMNIRAVALIVLPLSLTMVIPLFMIKEPDLSKRSVEREKQPGINLFQSLAYTFRNRSFILWMVAYAFMTFGVQLFLGGINEYFSFVGMSMIYVMVAAFAPVPFTLMLYNRIQRRFGFGAAFRYALATFSAGMLMMFAVGTLDAGTLKTVLSIVTGLVSSFAIGALFAVAYSVPAQLAAEEREKTGVSNSAMYFAVQGLFAGVATGIGTGIVLTALKGSQESASGAIVYLTVIAAAGTLVSLALTFALPKSVTAMGKDEQ